MPFECGHFHVLPILSHNLFGGGELKAQGPFDAVMGAVNFC